VIDPQAITEAKRVLGRQLAAFRSAAGLNQHQLAPLINYGRGTIANVETGRQTCSRTFWERCDQALNADGALVQAYAELTALIRNERAEIASKMDAARTAKYRALQDDMISKDAAQPSTWSEQEQPDTLEDVKRRTALVLPALSLLAVAGRPAGRPAEPWSRLSFVLEHPGQLDDRTMEELEWFTTELFRREEHLPSRQLAAHLSVQIDRLERLVGQAPASYERRLLMTLGEALALAGWVAWDSKETERAARLYAKAQNAATQAGDGPLFACVLAYRSYEAEAADDAPRSRQLLVEAQQFVRSEHSAGTRAWLAAREAEVDAALSEETPALRALDRAMTAYDYARPNRERSWTGFFTPSRLGSMAVTTYSRLDHPELDTTADSVVTSLPAVDVKIKAVILADLANAAIQRGRHERGAELGHQALDLTITHEASLGTQRLRDLHTMIRTRHDEPVLTDLDERLLAHVA